MERKKPRMYGEIEGDERVRDGCECEQISLIDGGGLNEDLGCQIYTKDSFDRNNTPCLVLLQESNQQQIDNNTL